MPDHLVGVAEVAAILGVSRQRVNELVSTRSDFPRPEAELAAGRIWTRAAIEEWAATRGTVEVTIVDVAGIPMLRPTRLDHMADAAAVFNEERPVAVDLQDADATLSRRCIDFLMGLSASRGSVEKLDEGELAFIAVPAGVKLTKAQRRALSAVVGPPEGGLSPARIRAYFWEQHQVEIGPVTAREVARTVARAAPGIDFSINVRGRGLDSGEPTTVTVATRAMIDWIERSRG